MRNKKKIVVIIMIIGIVAGISVWKLMQQPKSKTEIITEIQPVIGTIQKDISTTGTVLPKNRLEVKPPVNGRIEEILVQEGEQVHIGKTLAWMSSTERAALLDAARGQGEEALEYWKKVYNAIPITAPIEGEVIVAKTQPGQMVTTNDPVVVLSDKLIVRAQVDETDIGKMQIGQEVVISLDAYPDVSCKALVDHIYYESQTVNNVTIYEVDLIPEKVLPFFRSGMNATINFLGDKKEHILIIPTDAIMHEKNEVFVWIKEGKSAHKTVKRVVETGISDDTHTEITSGITVDDTVILKTKPYLLPTKKKGTNPFVPFRNQQKKSR